MAHTSRVFWTANALSIAICALIGLMDVLVWESAVASQLSTMFPSDYCRRTLILPVDPTRQNRVTMLLIEDSRRWPPKILWPPFVKPSRLVATGCEFDVYGCADGTVVLMHDKTVDRTTNGKGKVTQLTLKQLKSLDAGSWKSKRYRDERVPTLIEALTLLKDTTCQPVIEIKMEGISRSVVNDVRSLGMVDQVAVIAFSQNVVREIRKLEPALTCAWLCGSFPKEANARSVVQQAQWLHDQARQIDTAVLDLNFGMLSPQLVAKLKQRGLDVGAGLSTNQPS